MHRMEESALNIDRKQFRLIDSLRISMGHKISTGYEHRK